MSNSTLAGYTRITKNRTSPRNHKIDTITIHCYVGQVTAKQGCDYFATTDRECSANYVVGKDGSIGISVEEKDRSWCSSNEANDQRAVTIEVASDTKHPYAITDKAYAALLDLVTDICRRNGIKKLVWSTKKSDRVNHKNGCNMTVHRDYANKACPGDYLYNRHGAIAAEVNKRLGASTAEPEKPSTGSGTLYKVQTGAFKQKSNAQALEKKLKAAGFDTYVVNTGGYYKVQVGAFSKKANAEAMIKAQDKAKEIRHLQDTVLPKLKQQLADTKGIFKGKERKALTEQIQRTEKEIAEKLDKLPDVLKEDGYPDVQAYMATYRKAEAVVEQFNRDLAAWEQQVREKQKPAKKEQAKPPERESVLKRLRQLQAEGKQRNQPRQRKKSFDRDSR